MIASIRTAWNWLFVFGALAPLTLSPAQAMDKVALRTDTALIGIPFDGAPSASARRQNPWAGSGSKVRGVLRRKRAGERSCGWPTSKRTSSW